MLPISYSVTVYKGFACWLIKLQRQQSLAWWEVAKEGLPLPTWCSGWYMCGRAEHRGGLAEKLCGLRLLLLKEQPLLLKEPHPQQSLVLVCADTSSFFVSSLLDQS